jgi:hypothetical protein
MNAPKQILRAVERGWSIIPLRLNKKPFMSRWKEFQKRRASIEEVKDWARELNPPAWGLITGAISGVFILDFDKGDGGLKTLARLKLSPHVQTGRGGVHVYFQHPGYHVPTLNGKAKPALGKAYPGLDQRGDGGYAVFWGSNPDGAYKWLRRLGQPLNLAILPEDLRALLRLNPPANGTTPRPAPPKPVTANPSRDRAEMNWFLTEALKRYPQTGRHNAAFWLAVQMRDNRYSQGEAMGAMRAFGRSVPETSDKGRKLTLAELDSCVRDAYAQAPRAPIERKKRTPPPSPAPPAPPSPATAAPSAPPPPPVEVKPRIEGPTYHGEMYEATPTGLLYWKPARDGGHAPLMLSNFSARIVADLLMDDGAETSRAFKLAVEMRKHKKREVSIPARDFAVMNWPTEFLGANAIIYPNLKDHARTAIQTLSGETEERHVFRHTGWREVEEEWLYLHNGGAIGKDGAASGIEIELTGGLAYYALPAPPAGAELVKAIQASLRSLNVGPERIMLPLYSAIWRAVLGSCDVSLHISGHTGSGKTEFAALAQQHYGPRMDARHPPASWSSTSNALEALAFEAKDALLLVDDFVPQGNSADVAKMHREADRLLRAQGNHSGRQRMRADTTLRPEKPPRGLIVSTGEDVPKGQSLRARLIVLEANPDDMRWEELTECQRDASQGLYAQALAGFLQWMAPRMPEIERTLSAQLAEIRAQVVAWFYNRGDTHKRTPDNIANLALGFKFFLTFAVEKKAITEAQAEQLWQQALAAYQEAAEQQNKQQENADPCQQFIQLLLASLVSGRAHIASVKGEAPEEAGAWGWTAETTGHNLYQQTEWKAQGEKVGWTDGSNVYLEPQAAWAAVQRMARDSGEFIATSLPTLKRRLKQRHLLASTDQERESVTVRRSVEGRKREVLHFTTSLLPSTKPDIPDTEEPSDAPVSGFGVGFLAPLKKPDTGFPQKGN